MAPPSSNGNEAQTAESLIRDLERRRGVACAGCGAALDSHQVLMAIALGFKDKARCLPCLAAALGSEPAQLRDSLLNYIRQRDCYSEAWDWANRQAGLPEGSIPTALQSLPGSASVANPSGSMVGSPPLEADAAWDAGDLGCGELVLELRLRLGELAPGNLFHLTARDPGAKEDLPAWCRLTGHKLVHAEHPNYWISRKS